MKLNRLWVCLILVLPLLQSCATILTGSKEEVFFDSTPQGSSVEVDGNCVGFTPCTAKLKKTNHMVCFKKEGYKDRASYIERSFEPIFLGNLILGGPIGMLVDVCTGAVFQISPKRINVPLSEKSHPSIATESSSP